MVAYDNHCQGFFEDFKPQGSVEKHLTQTLADKQWQRQHVSGLLQSIQVLGQFELQDKIDVEHPEIHATLTASLVAVDKCKQVDPISCCASPLQRDYRSVLKDLQSLQAVPKLVRNAETAGILVMRSGIAAVGSLACLFVK